MQLPVARQIDNFIEALPQPRLVLAQTLREMLFERVPGIEERFSYKRPFYYYHGRFCYLHNDKDGLHLCFCRGRDLTVAFPQLALRGRATIASVTLHETKDRQQLEIRRLIAAAAAWNKEAAAPKIPLLKKRQP